MIGKIAIARPDGSKQIVDSTQFDINKSQRFAVIGVDDTRKVEINTVEKGYSAQVIGLLTTVEPISRQILINSLHSEGWDFIACENPVVIFIERKEMSHA